LKLFKKKREKFSVASGFTLLEIMIAMAVLAISLVAVFQSQSQSISMISRSRFETTAPLLAQAKMAELEAAGADDLISESGDFGEDYPDYSWEVQVEDTRLDYVMKIELIVRNERMKRNNAYLLELYRSVES